jgi:hypothetical protein
MKTNRTFGLEFEHISTTSHRQLADELTRAGVTVDPYATGTSRCREGCYSGWQVKTDGSISGATKYPTGIELVSPPMTFKTSKQVREAMKVAKKFGAVNSSCGLHVHVAAPELVRLFDDQTIQEHVRQVWQAVEKVLFTYVPPSRRMSDYCRGGVVWGTKYQAFNTQPLSGRGRTVEFRLHNATLNADKALAFAAICVGIVEKMIQGVAPDRILPDHSQDVPPKEIKTQKGGKFYLLRNERKWIIESPKITVEVPSLADAFKNYHKDLRLSGNHYLKAFHYPHYGNAMSKLCDFVGVNGAFRGYAEDRYERMLAKHGAADSISSADSITDDEEDYYNEPDYDEREAA